MKKTTEEILAKLSKTKQEKYKQLREVVIGSGLDAYKAIMNVENYKLKITDELRPHLKWCLDDLRDLVPMDYKAAYLLARIGDPETKEFLTYREFNFFQDLLGKVQVTGRENILKLYENINVFEGAMAEVIELNKAQDQATKVYGINNTNYAKFCNDNHVMPEDLESEIEELYNNKTEK